MPTIFISNRHSSEPHDFDVLHLPETDDGRNNLLYIWATTHDSAGLGHTVHRFGYDAYLAMTPAPLPIRAHPSLPAVGCFTEVTRDTPGFQFYCDPDRHGFNHNTNRYEPGCGRTVTLHGTQTHQCSPCHRCLQATTSWHTVSSCDQRFNYLLCDVCYDYLRYDMDAVCDRCERLVRVTQEGETVELTDGDRYCESCRESYTYICDRCDDIYESANGTYCEYCESTEVCSEYCLEMHQEECDSYQEQENRNNTGLESYSFTPFLHFNRMGHETNNTNLFMGVELETDRGRSSGSRTPIISNALNEISAVITPDSMFYFKEDGSLSNGMEIVSHPGTLDYHRETMPWKEVMRICKANGLKSHDTDTAGFHIHVSRSGLGETRAEREYTLAKLVMLMWRVWPELFAFSRRTEHNMYHWALPNHMFLPGVKDCECTSKQCNYCMSSLTLDLIRRDTESTTKNTRAKYTAVNTQHPHTLEFRLWRGTLKYETFIATMELTKLLVDTSRDESITNIAEMDWDTIITRAAGYNYATLWDYLTSPEIEAKISLVRRNRIDILQHIEETQAHEIATIKHRLEVAEAVATADILYEQTVSV